MNISFIIPCYNCENYIKKNILRLYKKLKISKIKFEIILIDDFSSDKTYLRLNELKNKLPLVRLPNKKVEVCNQALDAGCAGVIIPNIKNVSEFISIRNACYLSPSGNRGVGYSRANLFGKKFADYKKEKTKPIIIAMIENITSVENLEKFYTKKKMSEFYVKKHLVIFSSLTLLL